MVTSQNGYTANDRSQIETYQIGGKTKVALRKGPTGWLLQHLGNWFDANIRDIDPGIVDDWGYAERPIRGGTELSNHASGTALDVDATKWPLGVEPTKYLTKAEIATLKYHLGLYEGAIRWGGDYTGRKDPMHFEIDKPEAFCARIQAKLQSAPGTTPPSEEDDMLTIIQPGSSAVIPLPPGAKAVLLAVDEEQGGANVRVAVGWGIGKYHALNPDMAKIDGFTGWIHNGLGTSFPLAETDETLTVAHRAGRNPLGVVVLR